MKKKIQYYLNKYRQKKIMYLCLAILGLFVCVSTSFILMQSAKADENQSVLSPTLQSSQLYYVDSNKNQIEITDSTQIPANVSIRYKVKYNKFSVDALKDTDYTLSYKIPDFLLNPKVESGQGNLVIAQEKAGSIYVEDGYLKIKFNSQWLADKEGNNYTIEDLETWFDANVDLSKIDGEGNLKYNDGLVDKTIHFTPDIIARSIPVQVEKALVNQTSDSQDGKLLYIDGKYYLQYTLKVTLNSPGYKEAVTVSNVQVKDSFTSNEFIEGYYTSDYAKILNQPDNELYMDSDNHLIWNVGNITLEPNQSITKEKQYLVEIKKEYLQISNTPLENNATVSICNIERNTTPSVIYKPTENLTIKKSKAENLIHYEDGSQGIQYYVEITAPTTNSFPCEDVIVRDTINNQGINQYLSYDRDSIRFEKKNGDVWESAQAHSNPVYDDQKNNNGGKETLTWNIGTVKPGETYRICYVVKVHPSLHTFANNGYYTLSNSADAYKGKVDSNALLGHAEYSFKYYQTTWVTKDGTNLITNSETVKMNGEDVTIPENHFKYTVNVNTERIGNINNAVFKDELANNGLLHYFGYAKITGYTTSVDKPEKVAWLQLDENKSSFSFVPKNLGFKSDVNYAYRIEYYVLASRGIVDINANNTFSLNGDVIFGDGVYKLDPTKQKASKTLTILKDGNFTQKKYGWYYDSNTEEVYWLINIHTGALTPGFVIQDVLSNGSFGDNAVVAVFKGSYGDIQKEFNNLQEFKENNPSVKSLVLNEDYSVKKVNNTILQVCIEKPQTFEDDENLYLIVKSKSPKPASARNTITYTNGIQSGYNGNYSELTKASFVVTGSDSVLKEYAGTFTYDGSNWKALDVGRANYKNITLPKPNTTYMGQNFKDADLDRGTYVIWTVLVNYAGGMQGDAIIEDTLPDGVDLAYINYYWYGTGYRTRPKVVESQELSNWQKKTSPMSGYDHKLPYYQNGKTVRWFVEGLQNSRETGKTDQTAVEFQIATRVSDPNILLGQQSTTLQNKASIYADGIKLQDSNASVSLTKTSLTKKVLNQSSSTKPSTLDFEIEMNELAETLNHGNPLTLIDQMSSSLSLENNSLHIYKSDGTELDSSLYKMGYDTSSHQMTITVPDRERLKIQYSVSVNAGPNSEIDISNQAYWSGYTVGPGGNFEVKNYKYNAGGTASLTDNPILTILKKDAADSSKELKGAKFTIQQIKKYDKTNNEFVDVNDGTNYVVTTDENGKVILDKSSLEYNSLYKIIEIQAPDGYILDSKPKYFIDFNVVDGKYPAYENTSISIDKYYSTKNLEYVISNALGSVPFEKHFKSVDNKEYIISDVNSNVPTSFDGTYTFGIYDETNSLLKKIEMVIENGRARYYSIDNGEKTQIDSLKFTGLDCTKTYKIEELNRNQQFNVSYENNQDIQIDSVGKVNKIPIITNTSISYMLPETGSIGDKFMSAIGLVCMGVASGLCINEKKKKKK